MPRNKRIDMLVEKLGNQKIKKLALERAYTQGMTLGKLSEKYGLKEEDIRRILKYAIEHPTLISDNEAYLIADRASLNQFTHTKRVVTYDTKKYYTELLVTRSKNQRALQESEKDDENLLLEKIAELETFLANYEDIISSEDERDFPREYFEEKLKNLRSKLEKG